MELNFPVLMTTQTDLFFNHSSLHVLANGGLWKVSRTFGRSYPTLSYRFFLPLDWIDLMGWVAIIIVKVCIQPKSKNQEIRMNQSIKRLLEP